MLSVNFSDWGFALQRHIQEVQHMLRKIAQVNCRCGLVVVECYEQVTYVASLYNLGRGHGLLRGLRCSNGLSAGYR